MLSLLCVLSSALGDESPGRKAPIADTHSHFKWNQEDVTPAEEVARILAENEIVLAVIIGTPAGLALELQRIAGDRVVPFYSPYRLPGDWNSWYHDRGLPGRLREALVSGRYQGVGELHLIGGFAPDWRTPVISQVLRISREFALPVLLHTEFSRADYLLELCRANPGNRLIWAHAGGILTALEVRRVLQSCAQVWVDLSARDPWRYVRNPIVSADARLLPEWRRLLIDYPDRFIVGADAVWPVEQLDAWDEADTGWQEYARFMDFHRSWLARLPAPVGRKIRLENALRLFGRSADPDVD